MPPLLALVLLAQTAAGAPRAAAQPDRLSLTGNVAGIAGVRLNGAYHLGRLDTEPFGVFGVEGQLFVHLPNRPIPLLLEGSLIAELYLRNDGALPHGVAGTVRIGFAAGAWLLSVGVNWRADGLNGRAIIDHITGQPVTPSTVPTPFPSLLLRWRPGPLGFYAGLLDRAALPLARVGIEHRYFGLGWTALLGAEAWVRAPLPRGAYLEVRAYHEPFSYSIFYGGFLVVGWEAPNTPGAWR